MSKLFCESLRIVGTRPGRVEGIRVLPNAEFGSMVFCARAHGVGIRPVRESLGRRDEKGGGTK